MNDIECCPNGEAKRKLEVMKCDKYLVLDIFSLIKNQKEKLENTLGEQRYCSVLKMVDPKLFQQLDEYDCRSKSK